MVAKKTWVCHFNKKNKIPNSKRSTNCSASICIKVKKLNRDTIKNDKYLAHDPPLQGVITLKNVHNHNCYTFSSMKYLRATKEVRSLYRQYFEDGNGVAASMRLFEDKLNIDEDDDGSEEDEGHTKGLSPAVLLGASSHNPLQTTVAHWYRMWKEDNYGMDIDPLSKLEGKIPRFQEQGIHVEIVRDGADPSLWAILVVTPLMDRIQKSQESAGQILIDSTSSVDATEATVTPILAATKSGALPLSILIHNSQTIVGYTLAFGLLKKYNPLCFGGSSAPEAFMTDNSQAEKGALRAVWGDVPQLLCHFHIGQGEWRWLLETKNDVPQDQRRPFYNLFKEILYAKDAEMLETAIFNFNENCSHENYKKRIHKALENKEEWVLLFREWLLTQGHNTNNYSEAVIGVFKDVILKRIRALNVVALVDFIVNVWVKYFRIKILKFAYNRISAPHLQYEKLLKRMDPKFADQIDVLGEYTYLVPSASSSDVKYEVTSDIGHCRCYAGRQGAFCKHQALVHNKFGGLFPNAPAVTSADRYALAKLAVGKKCPHPDFFKDLQEGFEGIQVKPCLQGHNSTVPEENTASQHETDADVNNQLSENMEVDNVTAPQGSEEIDMQPLQKLQAELARLYNIGGHQSFVQSQVLSAVHRLAAVRNEGQVARAFHSISSALAMRATRQKRRIGVQPTSTSRSRPGAPRGASRIPSGRPAKWEPQKTRKRPHSLTKSVAANVKHPK